MEVARSGCPDGRYTQTQFNVEHARPDNIASIRACGSEDAPIPANIHSMQSAGRAWSRQVWSAPCNAAQGTSCDTSSPRSANRVRFATPEARPTDKRQAESFVAESFVNYRHLQSLQRACARLSRQVASADGGKHTQKYSNALNAIDRLIKAIGNQARRIPADVNALRSDAGGGMIAVDLDEAIHGLYTAISYITKAAANGSGEIAESLTQDANLWASDPMAWLTKSAMPHGKMDLGIATVVSVALVPFALMALHAGIKEMRESKRHDKALEAEMLHTGTFLETLEQILGSIDTGKPGASALSPKVRNMISASRSVCAQQLDDLKLARQQNREGGRIGGCSALSGGAIASKATLDVSSKIAYAATAGSAAGTTAATVAGVIGTLVLGPLAAIGAIGLGAVMVSKSEKSVKYFKAVGERTAQRLKSLIPRSHPRPGIDEYKQFVSQKLDQRKRFFHTYAKNNRRFLGGSALYAVSAITSAGLTVATLAGAGIALGPVGLGALIAVGVVGGLLMGRYSTQFLWGHARQHRYESYGVGDDPELDRHFLGTIEAFTHQERKIDPTTGIKMRAGFYKQASRREEIRQDFLTQVAADLGKRYHGMHAYSTDSETIRKKRNGAPGKRKKMRAIALKKYEIAAGRWRASKSYVTTLLHTRKHHAAKTAAGQSRRVALPYLSVSSLHDWLEKPENYPAQIKMMHSSLSAQTAYLQEKTATRLKIYALSNDIPAETLTLQTPANLTSVMNDTDADKNRAANLEIVLDQFAAPLARDVLILDQAKILKTQLEAHNTNATALPETTMAAMTARFLSLQLGLPYDSSTDTPDARQSHARLAHHYLKDAPGRHRNLRGLLIDAELQASRLDRGITANGASTNNRVAA